MLGRGRPPELLGHLPGLLAGLVCAGANLSVEEERDDGLLTAEEVAWLNLEGCELVVLSACQTGLGRAKSGEGLMSLRRSFRQAGATRQARTRETWHCMRSPLSERGSGLGSRSG